MKFIKLTNQQGNEFYLNSACIKTLSVYEDLTLIVLSLPKYDNAGRTIMEDKLFVRESIDALLGALES